MLSPGHPLTSVLLGVAGMFGWGLYDFLGGVLSRRLGSFSTLLWSQAAGAATVLLVAVPVVRWGVVTPSAAGLCLVASGLYCAGYLFFFAGFERGEVSVVAAVMNLWAVVTMLVAYLVMGQRLTPTQTVGAGAIILGATLASYRPTVASGRRGALSAGTPHTLAGAVFFGLYWNVSEVASEQIGWLATTAATKVGIVLVLAATAVARRRPGGAGARGLPWRTLAVMGLVEVAAVAAVNYGLTVGDAILITPVASALSVVTIGLALVVLRDRLSPLQGAGVVVAVLGIVGTAL